MVVVCVCVEDHDSNSRQEPKFLIITAWRPLCWEHHSDLDEMANQTICSQQARGGTEKPSSSAKKCCHKILCYCLKPLNSLLVPRCKRNHLLLAFGQAQNYVIDKNWSLKILSYFHRRDIQEPFCLTPLTLSGSGPITSGSFLPTFASETSWIAGIVLSWSRGSWEDKDQLGTGMNSFYSYSW